MEFVFKRLIARDHVLELCRVASLRLFILGGKTVWQEDIVTLSDASPTYVSIQKGGFLILCALSTALNSPEINKYIH